MIDIGFARKHNIKIWQIQKGSHIGFDIDFASRGSTRTHQNAFLIHIINSSYNISFQAVLKIVIECRYEYLLLCSNTSDRVHSFGSSPWTLYHRTLNEHKNVHYQVFEERNDVRPLKLSQRILARQLVISVSVWEVWRHICPQKLNRVHPSDSHWNVIPSLSSQS